MRGGCYGVVGEMDRGGVGGGGGVKERDRDKIRW